MESRVSIIPPFPCETRCPSTVFKQNGVLFEAFVALSHLTVFDGSGPRKLVFVGFWHVVPQPANSSVKDRSPMA